MEKFLFKPTNLSKKVAVSLGSDVTGLAWSKVVSFISLVIVVVASGTFLPSSVTSLLVSLSSLVAVSSMLTPSGSLG